MTVTKIKQRPLRLGGSPKDQVRTQFGALLWRVQKGEVQILLVTSRKSGKWVIPKGWPIDGTTPARAAAKEAWEEAGAEGKVVNVCLGIYSYSKKTPQGETIPCIVAVFPFRVKSLAETWPESRQRKRKWFPARKAAALVDGAELKRILREFDPKMLMR